MKFELTRFDFSNKIVKIGEDGSTLISWSPEKEKLGGIIVFGESVEDVEKKFKEASMLFEFVSNMFAVIKLEVK